MEVKGIIWVGAVSDDRIAVTRFFSDVMGMRIITNVAGFSRLAATNGDRLEFFGPDSVEHDHLDTGPVAGLWVDDAAQARAELIHAGVATVTSLEHGGDGHQWFYFKAPDGNFYEVCEHPGARAPRGSSS